MKLYWSSRSPYARKVMLAAHELGLAAQLELIPTVVNTIQPDLRLAQINPLGQIPVLLLADGTAIYDSLVICEYLDSIAPSPGLVPQAYPRRLQALTRHAVGQGMIDTLLKLFSERKRDDSLHPVYAAAHLDKFRRAATALDADCHRRNGSAIDIGDIAVACALAYADFRFAGENWRSARPMLADWYDRFAQRPSMIATEFSVAVR